MSEEDTLVHFDLDGLPLTVVVPGEAALWMAVAVNVPFLLGEGVRYCV